MKFEIPPATLAIRPTISETHSKRDVSLFVLSAFIAFKTHFYPQN